MLSLCRPVSLCIGPVPCLEASACPTRERGCPLPASGQPSLFLGELGAARPLGLSLLSIRQFQSTARLLADATIAVPSMGESITEGSIAAILKQPGVFQNRCGGQLTQKL